MGSAEKFCLRWNDFESNISVAFRELREDKDFFDVTLACDDDQIQAHKVILSACSPFFRSVLRKNPHQHPLLYLKGVKYADLLAVLNFMYHGEVNVAQEELNSFLAVAEDLRVKGLTQNNSSSSETKSSSNPPPSKPRPREPPERIDTGPPPKRPRPPPPPAHHAPSSSQDNNRQSFHANNDDDDDIQEVVPVKSEPVSHTETNNTVAMAPPEEPYDAGPGHGAVVDPGADNSSMYGGDDYGDYGQYGSEADGSFDGSMMDASMAGSASADGNKELDELINANMSKVIDVDGAGSIWNCDICGRKYKDKTKMKHHIETHMDKFYHVCPYCNQIRKTRRTLKVHLVKAHNVTDTENTQHLVIKTDNPPLNRNDGI